jgi:hypothetical protein
MALHRPAYYRLSYAPIGAASTEDVYLKLLAQALPTTVSESLAG